MSGALCTRRLSVCISVSLPLSLTFSIARFRSLTLSLSHCFGLCVVGRFPFSPSPSVSFCAFVADRVPVLGIKKPVAINVLQSFPRTPNSNVDAAGPQVYTGQGEYKPVSALASVKALPTLKFGLRGAFAIPMFFP